MRRTLGVALVLAACSGFEAACQPPPAPVPVEARLGELWREYTARYIRSTGEVVDPLRDGHVSSEAQSYAMLRAVLMRDRATFDRVYAWTRTHLRRADGLHAWLWDPAAQRIVDANTATDGDIDIAWALALASVTFTEPRHAEDAAAIVVAIRRHASLSLPSWRASRGQPDGGAWFPSAGNWAGPERIVNLSYFYPYVTPWFERLDPGHGWHQVDDIGFDLLEQALAPPAVLPADFNRVDDAGRLLALPEGHMLSAAFSYDSIRIVWRLELACRLGTARACRRVDTLLDRLVGIHARDRGFFTRYTTDGVARNDERSISFEGAMLPAFARRQPAMARDWRAGRLGARALDTLAAADNRYYDANWVWFGLALADDVLVSRLPQAGQLPPRRQAMLGDAGRPGTDGQPLPSHRDR